MWMFEKEKNKGYEWKKKKKKKKRIINRVWNMADKRLKVWGEVDVICRKRNWVRVKVCAKQLSVAPKIKK